MKLIFIFLLAALAPLCLSHASPAEVTAAEETASEKASAEKASGASGLTLPDSVLFPTLNAEVKPEAKPVDPFDTGLNYKLLSGLGVAYVGSGIVMHNYMRHAWWQNSEKFYFSNDYWSKLSNFNKFSHFYSVNLLGHLFSGSYEASGMQALGSTWYSSISALAYLSYVEVENGFHNGNGFSLSNFSADIVGTAFYIGQYYIPEMKSIMPKMSYKPAKKFNSGQSIVFDDYAGQKYWLSFRLKEFLPGKIKNSWPSFLMLALGTGIRSMDNTADYGPVDLYIALDLDAEKLPLYGPFWQFVKNTLNYFHFPMPGIRVTQKSAFFMFCF